MNTSGKIKSKLINYLSDCIAEIISIMEYIERRNLR